MAHTTDHPTTPAPGGPAWQDDPQSWNPYDRSWTNAPAGPPPAPAPGEGGGGGGPPEGRRRGRSPAGARRRFGALALAAALVAGAGAGAVTASLIGRGTTVVTAAAPAAAAAFSTTGGSAQSIIAKIEPALVDIHTTGTTSSASSAFGNGANPFGGSTSSTTEAAGTGMIIRSDGLVLTNAHVLEGSTTITVTFNGTTASHTATLVGEDAAKDIALIQIQGVSDLPTVTFGDSSSAVSGDQVLAIGNALDLQGGGFTASEGIISGLGRSIQTDNDESLTGLLQTSAAISSGDSGGPLVDASGQVIGMDTASAASTSSNTASNVGFSIPSNVITSIIGQLEKGSVGQTTVGSAGGSAASSGGSGTAGGYSGYASQGGSGGLGGYGSGYGGYSGPGGTFG